MPGLLTTEYSEAVAAAIQAERARKRKEIEKKIKGLEKEKDAVREQIKKFEEEQLNLHSLQEMWEEKKNKYNGNEVLSEVVIVNVFEGVCAGKIKDDFTACIKEMDQTYSKTGGLRENIKAQISRLQQYINDIDADIKGLRVKLNWI